MEPRQNRSRVRPSCEREHAATPAASGRHRARSAFGASSRFAAATQVLATIPDLFGPGRTAEMTYYEHWSGAKVFSAGTLDFGGQMLLWPQTERLVENVWVRLASR